MSLFSSKSSSSSKTYLYDYSSNATNEGSIGDFSNDNKIISAGQYTESGLVGENLDRVLDSVDNLATYNNSIINAVQSTAAKAIEETGNAYAESKNQLRSIIDSLQPLVMYGAIAAIFYFIFVKRG